MKQDSIKHRLSTGARLNGCWIETFSPIAAEIMAIAGYDTAMIDLEHGPGNTLQAISIMQAIQARGTAPLIRAGSNDPSEIKRILDIGPDGIMIPNLQTAQEARDAVAACRYAPEGVRGAAPSIIRATDYGAQLADYAARMRNDFLVIGQVESASAVTQIEDIAHTDGLDMLFIGPADLSASLGKLGEFDSEKFVQAFEKIEQVTVESDTLLGTIPFPGWSAERLYQNGHQLVISGADTLLLREAAQKDVAELREAIRRIKRA